ncbi:MAG TPA: hypothetical protein VES20_10910 [Bryobacteraceae bacterium]|nr:hypothetical protein [Bryobacteraceae bacterium]
MFGGDDQDVVTPVLPIRSAPLLQDRTFDWKPALNQSMRFLLIEHGFRLAFQPQTRSRLRGPFLSDYAESVKALGGWSDGDNWFLNYVAHPMQGAMTGYIQVQNDYKGRMLEFSNSGEYWRSRLKALAWNTAYSTQFEIGLLSESSIGNVGQRKGTSGYVDFVMTPAGGFAVMVAEDALDKYLVKKWEGRTGSLITRGVYRVALNPCRTFANVLRGKTPWHRDTRPLDY